MSTNLTGRRVLAVGASSGVDRPFAAAGATMLAASRGGA